ncbi:MAG: tripartite tricarboxylate transporter substrate-binding protein [Rhodospirillales bacterium]|nr:tripartite tricarboxylate transporter substrate-binding protein [Rhodospirillales bacterium]
MKTLWKTAFISAFVLALSAMLIPSAGQAASGFYDGKVITLIVPNSPGGRMTRYARLYAPYIAQYSGAKEVRIVNKKGGGGVKGTNFLWSSKPDGSTIAFTSVPTLILAQLSGSKAVQFDATKFVYLGRAATEPRVMVVGGTSKIKSIQDVQKMGRPFVNPSQGTDEDFYTLAVLGDSLDFKLKIVTGYEGQADTGVAIIKGDGDGLLTSWAYTIPLIKNGDMRPILTIWQDRHPDYPNVPSVLEMVKGDKKDAVQAIVNMLAMHRGFFGPPNMDPKATAALRAAISKASADSKLQAEGKKQGLILLPSDGETEQARIVQITKASQGIVPVLKAALQSIK